MATVFLATRDRAANLDLFRLAEILLSENADPVVFAPHTEPDDVPLGLPVTWFNLPSLNDLSSEPRVLAEVALYASRTRPSVVVEHTAPAVGPDLSAGRLILVPALDMEDLRRIKNLPRGRSYAFLLADHPRSPTWTYDDAELAELESWKDWHFGGPLFPRLPPNTTVECPPATRTRLDKQKTFIFCMGLDRVSRSSPTYVAAFCDMASHIAGALRSAYPSCQIMMIHRQSRLGDCLRVVPFEVRSVPQGDLPLSLAGATAVIADFSHAAIHACIAASIPFATVDPARDGTPRTTKVGRQPLEGRIDEWLEHTIWRPSEQGFASLRSDWRATTRSVLRGLPIFQERPSNLPRLRVPRPPRNRQHPQKLLVRVDDVTELDGALVTTLRLCATRGLHVSLEVVPFLCHFDEIDLRRLLGPRVRFEISQHGYSHLLRYVANRKAEFTDAIGARTTMELGRSKIKKSFPNTFVGGFSAPYNYYPPGLALAWAEVGGLYVSASTPLPGLPIPVVSVTTDPWDWSVGSARPLDDIVEGIKRSLNQRGYAGIVLHPQLVTPLIERQRLAHILDIALSFECSPALISEVAFASGADNTSDHVG